MTTPADLSDFNALRAEPALLERGLELGDILGAGGTAVVYRARDLRHERDVAVKILHRNLESATAEARFAQEIRVAAGLRHPNVLPLFDSGTLADGRLFAVMPVAEGRPLAALIKEGPLAIADAVRLARETAEALAYLHERGYVHRDVKPENILVEAGHAVLTDFGLATSAVTSVNALTPRTAELRTLVEAGAATPADDNAVPRPDDERLTRAGTALGTLPYMSPEALVGDAALDSRADTYSLGVVLYEMLTGRLPFSTRSPMELLARRTREPWPSARAARAEVSDALDAVVARATALEPADRFPSATAMAATLSEVALPDASRLLRRPLGWRAVAGIVVLVGALGAAAWFGITRVATLDGNRIVVADLVNDSGDPSTANIGVLAGDIITAALTTGTALEVVNATVALPSRLQRSTPVADTTMARETRALVSESHAGLVVTGAYFRSGVNHEFVAEVIDSKSGRVVGVAGPVRAASESPDSAMHALADSIVSILRQRTPAND